MLCCRAKALIEGRFTPSIEDVAALARPVLRHRMALSFAAHAEQISLPQIIEVTHRADSRGQRNDR